MSDSIQYTIRNVPPALDAQLKAQAKKRGISLNKLLLDMIGALTQQVGRKAPKVYHDLDWFYGTMTVQEADELDEIIRQARETDRQLARKEFEQHSKIDQGADEKTDESRS